MQIKKLNKTAFTLLEVLLAAIIFIISIGGLFATLNAVRSPVTQKENALSAAITGQQVLNYLRSQVNAQTYYNGCSLPLDASNNCPALDLSTGPHLVPSGILTGVGISWPNNLSILNATGLNYTVLCADGSSGAAATCNPAPNGNGANLDQARQVTLNITS